VLSSIGKVLCPKAVWPVVYSTGFFVPITSSISGKVGDIVKFFPWHSFYLSIRDNNNLNKTRIGHFIQD
jgi:hypothetical protein